MKISIIVSIGLLIGVIVSGCGGNGADENQLAPKEISKEHQGLSLNELKSMASGISYEDLIGHPGEGMFFDTRNPKIIENVEKHAGTLIYAEGILVEIDPTENESHVTAWLCPTGENTATVNLRDQSSDEAFSCLQRMLLLYDVNSGPTLTKGGVVEVIGTIVSGYKGTTFKITGHDRSRSFSYHPTVSVIKVAQVRVSEWEPSFTIN